MKLLVIGCGQCGGRIADEFARLNKVARTTRGFDIVTGVVAVNTDIADLSGLFHIKSDFKHRILIGGKKTGGHGVGKMNEIGAEIAREDGDKIIDAIRAAEKMPDTDAILVIASAGGGTGSGSIPVLTKQLKERYTDKPVYNLIVLPFAYEETNEERSVYNVGSCLKSAYLVADAVFLVDNQRYIRKNFSLRSNLSKINHLVVRPFFNLLCAGEETDSKFIGSKVLDAGDIIQTLSGWTVVGYGSEAIPKIQLPFAKGGSDFRDKSTQTQRGVRAITEAIDELSMKCNPTDAKKALYLLTAPYGAMNMDLIKELSFSLKSMASEAIIRSGDYPYGKGMIEVTIILSELINSRKVMDYFTKAINLIGQSKRRQGGIEWGHRGIEEAFKDIPSLLD
jgi:cell division GTPase FtsZ